MTPENRDDIYHTSFSIILSNVKNFIEDIPKLVQLEPKGLCGIEQYIETLMNYVTASNAYLGNQENVAEFDSAYYRSKDPMAPRLYEDIFEEIGQIGI